MICIEFLGTNKDFLVKKDNLENFLTELCRIDNEINNCYLDIEDYFEYDDSCYNKDGDLIRMPEGDNLFENDFLFDAFKPLFQYMEDGSALRFEDTYEHKLYSMIAVNGDYKVTNGTYTWNDEKYS